MFVFATAAESGKGAVQDSIPDFVHGTDRLDLYSFMPGGQFIGGAGFVAGNGPQVRYVAATGSLAGDVTGDGSADFALNLAGSPDLTLSGFVF